MSENEGKDWDTALLDAAKSNDIDAMEQCLLHDISKGQLQSALLWTAHLGHVGATKYITDTQDVDIDEFDQKSKHNALSWALQGGYLECAQVLIDAGSDYTKLSDAQTEKYSPQLKALGVISPYTYVNKNIVIKYEGHAPQIGALQQIFNFKKRTVTERVGEAIGPPVSFDQFHMNKADIEEAYQWIKKRHAQTAAPFSPPARNIKKR